MDISESIAQAAQVLQKYVEVEGQTIQDGEDEDDYTSPNTLNQTLVDLYDVSCGDLMKQEAVAAVFAMGYKQYM